MYAGENANVKSILYTYDKNALVTAVIFFNSNNTSIEDLIDFLQQLYSKEEYASNQSWYKGDHYHAIVLYGGNLGLRVQYQKL